MKRKNKNIKVIRKYPYEEVGIFASQREVARVLQVLATQKIISWR